MEGEEAQPRLVALKHADVRADLEPSLLSELHILRMDCIGRIRSFRERYLSTTSGSILAGICRKVDADLQFKFQQLAMICFFESTFVFCGVDSGTELQKPPAVEGLTLKDQLEHQRVMTGSARGDHTEDDDSDSIDADTQEIILATVTDPSISRPLSSHDISLARTLMPSLTTLDSGSSNDSVEELRAFTAQLQNDGLFDLLPAPLVYQNYDAMSQAELRPKLQFPAPLVEHTQVRFARAIRRQDLLDKMNIFLMQLGLPAVNRRDPIWREWFLRGYLRLSETDYRLGRPLLVVDRSSTSTFIEAISRMYHSCITGTTEESEVSSPPKRARVEALPAVITAES